MSRPPCRFFSTPAGCNRGNQCKFAHSSPNDTPPLQSPDNAVPPQNTTCPSGNRNPPPGACRFFWEQGRCKREFNCHYKHTQRVENSTPSSASTSRSFGTASRSASVLQQVAPFLTEQGLSKMSGSGTDGFFPQDPSPLSPSEAHNALKRYLSEYFRFKHTFEIYAFLKPLNSATTSNAGWVRHPIFVLATIVLIRLPDSRRWPSKSWMVMLITNDVNCIFRAASFANNGLSA